MDKPVKDSILEQIGSNIKTARLLKGYTQEYLAEKLNKTTNFISLIERGQTGIGIKTIIDICNILDLEPNSIFNGLLNYDNQDNKTIIDGISVLSKEDKEIVINLIEYIKRKCSK